MPTKPLYKRLATLTGEKGLDYKAITQTLLNEYTGRDRDMLQFFMAVL